MINKNNKNENKVAIILGIMCMFLSIAIVTQINTVKNSTTTVGKTLVENELRDSVLRWKQKYENAYAKLEAEEVELTKLRDKISTTDSSSSISNSKLIKYNSLLGNTELIGKGIIITLTDGDNSLSKVSISDVIVHDSDLLQIVNALKNADADAISVNDQRIVSSTSISCVGNVVKINQEKVGVPFVVKAIGSPNQLYGALTMVGGYLEILETAGVKVKVEQVDKETIVIPKYEGIYKFNYASIDE